MTRTFIFEASRPVFLGAIFFENERSCFAAFRIEVVSARFWIARGRASKVRIKALSPVNVKALGKRISRVLIHFGAIADLQFVLL